MRGEGENLVLLPDVAEPVLPLEARAEFLRDALGAVGAPGVEDDNLVSKVGTTAEAARQVGFLVEGDEAEGDSNHADSALLFPRCQF